MFYFYDPTLVTIVVISFIAVIAVLAIHGKVSHATHEKDARTVNAKVLKIDPPNPQTVYIGGECNEIIFEIEGGDRIKLCVKTDVLLVEGESGKLTYYDKQFYAFNREK